MTVNVLSYTFFGVGLLAFASWFVRKRALGRDPSPAGLEADAALRRQLRLQLILGFVALIGAAVL
jgi:hypothetical protein